MKTTVLGGGSWGTALAAVLAENGPVRLWARSSQIAEHINDFGRNPVYQSDIDLPEELTATTDMQAALAGAELVCIVVPSHAMRTVMSQAAVYLPDNAALVSASKGIENDTLMTMDDVLREVLPPKYHRQLAYLSGPSFARETLLKMATAVTIAAHDDDVCEFVQRTFAHGISEPTEPMTSLALSWVVRSRTWLRSLRVLLIAWGLATTPERRC